MGVIRAFVATVAIIGLMQVCPQVSQARDGEARSLEGSWTATATSTTVPLPPLKLLMTFMRDGTLIEARRPFVAESPIGPLLTTAGHGGWVRTGRNEFAATIIIIHQGAPNHPTAPGQVLATEKVRFKLSTAGQGTFTGTLLVDIRDNDGNVVFNGPGIIEGSRIEIEPLP